MVLKYFFNHQVMASQLEINEFYIIRFKYTFKYIYNLPKYMNNSQLQNSCLFQSQKTPQEYRKSKYKKFNYPPKSQLHKQVSIESLSKSGKKSQKFILQFNTQGKGMGKNKSQSNLNGYKTPKKLPRTPRKQLIHVSSSQKISNPISLNELILKFKIILRDFQRLVFNIQSQFKRTIQQIMKNAQKQMLQFLSKQMNCNHINDAKYNEDRNNLYKFQQGLQKNHEYSILKQFSSQNKVFEVDSGEIVSSPLQNTPRNFMQNSQSEHKSGGNFSNMIKLRQKIRKDAHNAVTKSTINKYQQQLQYKPSIEFHLNQNRGSLYKSSRAQLGNSAASNSIQKLQRQLNSLKCLLDQQ